jgi:hypothetical protein
MVNAWLVWFGQYDLKVLLLNNVHVNPKTISACGISAQAVTMLGFCAK